MQVRRGFEFLVICLRQTHCGNSALFKCIVEFLFEIISKKKQIFIEAVSFGL